MSDAQERLLSHEQQCGEQSRLIAELTVKAEQNVSIVESLKDKLHETMAERRAIEGQLHTLQQKQQDVEQQNRELMGISGRKEDMVQRLQSRVEELVQEVATLAAQAESAKTDSRRQVEQIKERASSKVRG